MNRYTFPLFKGCTRLAMFCGVPIHAFIGMLVVIGALAMFNLKAWLLLLLVWPIMWQITKHDDKMFRIWGLYIDTRLRQRLWSFMTRASSQWKASSYTPHNYKNRW